MGLFGRKTAETEANVGQNGDTANTYDPDFKQNTTAVSSGAVNERRLIAKVDFRLIPVLSILYLLAFLDRTNIGNAQVYGLSADLGIPTNSTEFNNALVLFFPLYIIFEIPSNVLLKKFKPHIWLSFCMLLFGIITTLQGLASSVGGLYAARLFLGLAEAGMFPGCFYLIGMWYTRREAQKRFSFFFSSTSLAGAFGGLLAAALSHMDGIQGKRAWRWVFIIEGLLTVAVSFIFFFVIPDFPEDAKFLSPQEREFIKLRLEQDQGRAALDRDIRFADVLRVFSDYKVIVMGFAYFGLIVPAYGYAYFSPSIIQGFGYSPVETQLHSVPPWAAAFGFSMVLAYISDKARRRFPFILFGICVGITGFAMLLSRLPFTTKYGALFLVTSGTYGSMPIIVAWFNMNLGGHHRRAVGSAWQIGFGNIGGIIAVYAFLLKDGPLYIPGYAICISFSCLAAIASTVYFFGCWTANRHRASVTDMGTTDWEDTEKGDMSPRYRYML